MDAYAKVVRLPSGKAQAVILQGREHRELPDSLDNAEVMTEGTSPAPDVRLGDYGGKAVTLQAWLTAMSAQVAVLMMHNEFHVSHHESDHS